jgi:hypothetical protein
MLVGCFPGADHDDYDDHAHEAGRPVAGRPASPSPAPSGDFCQQWATAACSDAVVSACQASDAAECRQSQADFCHMLSPSDISSSARDACISAVGAAYRDADLRGDELALVLRFGGACARLVVGSSKAGDTCSESSQCELARGYTCVKKADSNDGTCQIPQVTEAGRDCQAAQKTCTDGFFCDGHNCIETLKSSETCDIQEQCGEDAYCNDKHECEARHKVNDSCQNDFECAHGICAEFAGQQVCTDRIVLSRADPVCANLR